MFRYSIRQPKKIHGTVINWNFIRIVFIRKGDKLKQAEITVIKNNLYGSSENRNKESL